MPAIPLIIEHMNPLPPFEEKLGQSPAPHIEVEIVLPDEEDVAPIAEITKPKKKRVRKPVTTSKVTPPVEKRSRPAASSSKRRRCATCKQVLPPVTKEKVSADKRRKPVAKESSSSSSKRKPVAVQPKKKVKVAATATKQKEKELLYKVNDLRNLCREKKISNFSRMNKGQMIEVLAL